MASHRSPGRPAEAAAHRRSRKQHRTAWPITVAWGVASLLGLAGTATMAGDEMPSSLTYKDKPVDYWLDRMSDTMLEPSDRWRAGVSVTQIYEKHAGHPDLIKTLPKLLLSLEEAGFNREGGAAAARALGLLGHDAVSAVGPLLGILQMSNEEVWYDVRMAAAAALGRIGEANQVVVSALRNKAEKDITPGVRSASLEALHRLLSPAEGVTALTRGLKDADAGVRWKAACLLAETGEPAQPAVAALEAVVAGSSDATFMGYVKSLFRREHDPRDKGAAGAALLVLGRPAPGLPAVGAGLSHKNRLTRQATLQALGSAHKAEASLVVPLLVKALDDTYHGNQSRAARLIGARGEEAFQAVPALQQALSDPEPLVRQAAAEALGKIGPRAVASHVALVHALSDKSSYVRRRAATALGRLGPGAATAHPALAKALTDKSRFVRREAATALSLLGPGASGARPALERALEDKSPSVRRAAKKALKNIGGNK